MKFLQKKLLCLLALLHASLNFTQNDQNAYFNTTQLTLATAAAATGYLTYQIATQPTTPTIDVKNLAQETCNFPKNFAWGVSTASTQTEENTHNNTWAQTYLQTIPGKEHIKSPGFACKSFTCWQDDIDKVAYLGCNSYRLSIEWSKVQTTPDTFDEAIIAHYVEIVQYCQKLGIEPIICLHHYSDPAWFMEKGGFTQEENLTFFELFCKKMYTALCPYVSQWIVISQPVAYAVKSYKAGMMPPFLKNSGLEDTVMLNLFKAHIHVYDMMHESFNATHNGQKPQIGICHQLVQMQTSKNYNPIKQAAELIISYFGDRLYNETLLRFFTNGHFQSLAPIDIAYLPNASEKFDFFALSYYSPLAFNWATPQSPVIDPEHTTRDEGRIIYKEGMYEAIARVAKLGKPIYVVENGINPKTDEQRNLLLNEYLSAISQALADGYDVRGYNHWTLMDNYEWANANLHNEEKTHISEFGLYKNRVKNDQTGELLENYQNHETMLKPSGQHYKNIVTQQKGNS